MLRVLDLFSGIGGFSLGLERTGGFKTVAFCEIEPFCQKVLAKHWPEVPVHPDVTTMQFIEGQADVITAGFPCQDISSAGSGAGLSGERSGLFREVVRAIRMVRPKVALLENVADLLDRGMGEVCRELAEIGYDAEWDCIPTTAIGAPHVRDRIWISAHPNEIHGKAGLGVLSIGEKEIQAEHNRNSLGVWLEASRPAPGVDDGLPEELDQRQRTEALGNTVVPQIPELIGRAILASNKNNSGGAA